MENVTLKRLTAENFASFADKVEFSSQIDSAKKENMSNTFSLGEKYYNKVSFLYGANGSGKTFFCKILREIQRIIDWSPLTAMNNNSQLLSLPQLKGIDNPVTKFVFDTQYEDKPTTFSIELVIDETIFCYKFSIDGRKIVYELLTKKNKRTEKLLERTSPSYKDIELRSELKSFDTNKQVVKEEALCLAVAALLNNELASKVIFAIKGIQVVNMTAANLSPIEGTEAFSEERLKKYAHILQKADPTIRKMSITLEEKEIARQKFESDDFENREFIAKNTTVAVETQHAVYNDGEETSQAAINFFSDESLGTVKLFTALPYLFEVLDTGGVLVVDEIENGLHLSLVKEIVALFSNEATNPNCAQLICTSHQPLLLDGDFRRDQVWVMCKDEYGRSSLHRMSDFKTSRSKFKLTNKILDGAFGCNPNLFFNNIL